MENISEAVFSFYFEKKYKDKSFRSYQFELANAIHSHFRNSDLIISDGLRQYTHYAEIKLIFSKQSGFLMVNIPKGNDEILDLFCDQNDEIAIVDIQISDIGRIYFLNWRIFKNDNGILSYIEDSHNFSEIDRTLKSLIEQLYFISLSSLLPEIISDTLFELLAINSNEYYPNLHEIIFGNPKLVMNSNLRFDY
jgi:hypothetical protein